MIDLPEDPLGRGGIAEYARRLRSRQTTVSATVEQYLRRIDRLEPRLGAFEHVAAEQSLAAAGGMDLLLAAGVDLGPLMGVPVVLKDLIAVDGMPLTCGSSVDVSDLVFREGRFVGTLRRAGCVLLGKSKTVEFARGGSGISRLRGTPWNPWDGKTHRVPGGSSSGSAVAMAAGLCGFAIGTDTGGSVRGPAALCGIFGHKTTHGLWPLDGVYPNSHSFDSIGTMTRSAADAAIVFGALTGQAVPAPPPIERLRFGKPEDHFFDDLHADVEHAVSAALERLAAAGATIVPVAVPEAGERKAFADILCATEFVANLGKDRFIAEFDRMDPLTATRALPALDIPAPEYIRMQQRQRLVQQAYCGRFVDVDAWLTSTVRVCAPEVEPALVDMAATMAVEALLGANTHLVSYFGLCATTTPIPTEGTLPVGLQTICPGGADARALSVAIALENLFGAPPRPDMSGFH